MRPFFAFVVLTALPLAAQTAPASEASGHISGKIVNQSGDSIAHARVCFGHFDGLGGHSTCGPEADDEGRFNLAVPMDTNRVSAEKPSDGYWSDPDLARGGQLVSLTSEKPSARLLLNLGQKPARITFSVIDKETGLPITDVNIQIAQVDESITTRSVAFQQDSIAVPPDKDMLIVIQANGYKRWFYMDEGANQPTVHLQSGEERNAEVNLEPASKPN